MSLYEDEPLGAPAPPPGPADDALRSAPVTVDGRGGGGGGITRRRRRTAIITVCVLILVAGLSWWAGRATTTTSRLAHRARPPKAPVLTAPAVRKRLGTTLRATGTIVAAGSETISVGSINVPGAESVVTASVVHDGQHIGNGSVVAQVAGRPVFVFAGRVPMYRSLSGGESGGDIAQLQRDLTSLGYGITDTAGSYGPSTSAALGDLYHNAGYTPPPSAPSGGRHGNRLIVEPQSEIVFVPTLPAVVASVKEPIGKSIGSPAVTLTYGSVVVNATLTAAQGYLAEPHDRASVSVGRGRPLTGTIRSIKRSVQKPTATATIALSGVAADSHIGSHVAVTIDAESSAAPTLAVPIGALYASGSGGAYVILAHGHRHLPVTVGQAVGGYVPIVNPPVALLPGTSLVLDASQANGGALGNS